MNLFRQSGNSEHFPEKACPGLDRGWIPVFQRKCDHGKTLEQPGVAKAADHKYPLMARQWALFSIVGGSIQPM
jgi:hypothetical protein